MPVADRSPGHVFVLRGDLTGLTCDAWLLPTDRRLRVGAKWHHALPDGLVDGDRLAVEPPAGWGSDGPGSFPLPGIDEPSIWPTDVGGSAGTPVSWHRRALAAFVDAAAHHLAGRPTCGDGGPGEPDRDRDGDRDRDRDGDRGSGAAGLDAGHVARARPLLAVPVVGSGAGGGGVVIGALLGGIVDELQAAVERTGVDVALVTNEPHAFAAAQAARRSRPGTTLPDHLAEAVERLARAARSDQLVLFLGGGVSMGAGLPSWRQLLDRLAAEAGLPESELGAFARLDVLDQGRIVQHRLERAGVDIGELLCRILASPRTSLAHALLANLPVDEVVTTNYDDLFEMASAAAGRPVAVLPYERSGPKGRWLLKLHGSVDRPDEIVLTREDYLRYRERRAALAGIVQAMLMTRHMVFVGFSLSDDNFHRIVDEVRRALHPADDDGNRPFATALLLRDEPLLAELWAGEVDFVAAGASGDARAGAARLLEIVLDQLVLESSDLSAHLLDGRFGALLSPDEARLRDSLEELAAGEDGYRDAPAWRLVAELLHRLGRKGPVQRPHRSAG